ncbi:hypothetical protein DFP73DRAFT_629790 [Morchella snyderi]|nr:hypothetical protein DFP73DRAFT_629790 [Morchella snyderi]
MSHRLPQVPNTDEGIEAFPTAIIVALTIILVILTTPRRWKRVVDDELLEEGIAKPKGIELLTEVERVSAVETEVSNLKASITDGFNRIEGWIKNDCNIWCRDSFIWVGNTSVQGHGLRRRNRQIAKKLSMIEYCQH